MEDLVRVRASDPGERALVAQERVEAAIVAGEDLAQQLHAESKRLRADVRQLLVGLLRRLQPDAGPLLRAGLGEDELAAVLEAKSERRPLRAFRSRREVANPPRAHQVDPQLELAVVGREEEPFAAAAGALEAPTLERAQRRVEGLQRGDVGGAGLEHRRRRDERVELPHPGFHFG